MSGDCSAKRPDKNLESGAQGFVLCGEENRKQEVGVLSVDAKGPGSSDVRNMTCGRGWSFWRRYTKCSNLCHAREKFAACGACAVRCTVYTLRRLQGNRHFL